METCKEQFVFSRVAWK